jgi:hypothetical protein
MKFSAIGIAVGAAFLVLAGGVAPLLQHCGAHGAMMRSAIVSYVGNLWPKCDVRHSGRRNAMH